MEFWQSSAFHFMLITLGCGLHPEYDPFLKRNGTLSKVTLSLLIHSHQPVGNFDHVIEEAYQKSYLPFAETVRAQPHLRLSLHYSGILLEWMESHHPEFLDLLGRLVHEGRAEIVGGGYYEPILPAIPDEDKIAQIRKLADFIEKRIGQRPRGAWVAERVWEPSLARPLAQAGVEYVLLDDTHFLAAGLSPHDLHGTYVTDEVGFAVRLVPSLKVLRYTIPFREPEETLHVLEEGRGLPSRLFAFGDDCEKFGVWPGTYGHCYKNKWLEKFFQALESSAEWLETIPVGEYVATHSPLGRVYLPTASYPEMMEWALSPEAAREFKRCLEDIQHLSGGERIRRFLRGGLWQNFLSKYSEANQLHKLMLEVSRRWHAARQAHAGDKRAERVIAEAETHLLAGQCNDPYWHGVFGGLYAPHLRSAVLSHLIQAESLLDRVDPPATNPGPSVESRDFDADGHEEVLERDSLGALVVRPAQGGTISSLRFKRAGVELVNSLTRRPEAYHDLVRQKAASPNNHAEGPASIHDRVLSKEANLDALLRYDRYTRQVFRTYLFRAHKGFEDYENLRLEEHGELAAGPWKFVADVAKPGALVLERDAALQANGGSCRVRALKTFQPSARDGVWSIECCSKLSVDRTWAAPMALGLELVFNLLAPEAPDRYLEAHGHRWPLRFKGEIESEQVLLVDEWQCLRLELEARPEARWWVMPIETISQSESGFERVYQGSALLAVWRIDFSSGHEWTSALTTRISRIG